MITLSKRVKLSAKRVKLSAKRVKLSVIFLNDTS